MEETRDGNRGGAPTAELNCAGISEEVSGDDGEGVRALRTDHRIGELRRVMHSC